MVVKAIGEILDGVVDVAVIGFRLNYRLSNVALLVPLSLSIEINMLNDEVSCNLLLLLAVLNGSVSQEI